MHPNECIIDVGSASVGICLLETGHEKPLISHTSRVLLSDGSENTAAIAVRAGQAVQKALDTLKSVPPPKQVRITLAAPWYDAKIRTIVSSSEKQVRVTTGTVERSVKEYLAKKSEGAPASGRRLIESVVTQTYVNGYPTALKKPVLGTGMKINYYYSEADDSFIAALTDLVKKAFPHAAVSFHSFALSSCLMLRTVRPEDNFIMADVGGEITEIVIAHHDGLRFIGTFPVGTLSIIRAIAGSGSLADATSRLTLFGRKELSTEEMANTAQSFEAAAAEWQKGFQNLLETAVKEVGVPQTTFLFAEKDELKWLQGLVTGSHGVFSTRAVPVFPDFFQSAITLGEEAVYDSYLNLESLFFHARKQNLVEI